MIIGVELSASITIPLSEELTLESVSPIMSQFAILPPVKFTWEPVTVPPAETLNLLDEINDTGSDVFAEDDITQYGE